MRRIAIILAVLAWPGLAGAGERAELPIAPRTQAAGSPEEGWCGETALQEALLYYGAYVPQAAINRAGKPRHPDLYWGDLPAAMKALGLRYRAWGNRGGMKGFLSWVRREIDRGRPLLVGVKIQPTAHPSWGLDHMVLFTGYAPGAVRINTTWGHAVTRTHRQLGSRARGLSLRNRSGLQHAFALDGLGGGGPRVRLEVRRERPRVIELRAVVSGLEAGRRYALVRTDRAGGKAVSRQRFTAGGGEARLAVRVPRGRAAYFRVAVDSAP